MTTGGWVERHSWALVVTTGLVVGALLLLPAYLLLWFSAGLHSGALCNLGYQPWCKPGHGLPEWYTLATVACLGGSAWASWRASRVAVRWAVASVLLAALALGWALVRDDVREHLPFGVLM